MIDWTTIKPALKSLFVDLSKLTSAQIRWRDESEGSVWTADPTIYLAAGKIGSEGIAQELREDEGTDDETVVIADQKTFVINVRAETFSQDLADIRHAGSLLETIKTRLNRTTTTERLHAILALNDWTDTTPFQYRDEDGRLISAYAMDLFCTTVDNDTDDAVGAGGYITEVLIDGTVDDGGVLRPISLDIKEP